MTHLVNPDVHSLDLVDVYSKNLNNASSQRIICTCGRFLGPLSALKPLDYGRRMVKCEELSLAKPEHVAEYLRMMKRDPTLASRKGCGRVSVFTKEGQVERVIETTDEMYANLCAALDRVRQKKEADAIAQDMAQKSIEFYLGTGAAPASPLTGNARVFGTGAISPAQRAALSAGAGLRAQQSAGYGVSPRRSSKGVF
jgi:hypothetical protein